MLAIVVLLIEGASYLAVVTLLAQRGDRLLASATNALVRDLRTELERGKPAAAAIETAVHDLRFGDVTLEIRLATPTDPRLTGAVLLSTVRGPTDGGDTRVRSEVVEASPLRFEVTATRSLFEDQETLEAVQRAYLLAAALAIALSALVTWRLASAALAPVEALTARAATLGSGDLHERLPGADVDNELGRLSLMLNGMLERIDGAFAQQRQFVADASHELRTPIAVLRTEIDVTRANADRSATEYRETLQRVHGVTGRLERLVADLFLLARTDAGGSTMPQDRLDMTALVHETCDLLTGLAEERGVQLVVESTEPMPVLGLSAQLERVMLNLLDNALRFAPRESTIRVTVLRDGPSVCVEVQDAGPGVPESLRPHVFDRFRRRGPDAGAPTHDGAGLGLAIAQSLVRAHGGKLSLRATGADGSTFRIVLPTAA